MIKISNTRKEINSYFHEYHISKYHIPQTSSTLNLFEEKYYRSIKEKLFTIIHKEIIINVRHNLH